MIDLEPAPQGTDRHGERLRGAEVAGITRERAPADLHADPVPGPDPVARRIELDVHRQHLVVPDLDIGSGYGLRREPPDAVHDVAGHALEVDVTDLDEKVGVLAAGAREDTGPDRPDQVQVGAKRVGGKGQDIRPGFDRGVIDLLARRQEEGSASDGVGFAGS